MSDNLEFEISKDYTWYVNDLTDEELKTFIENLKLTPPNCSIWLWVNRHDLHEIRTERYIQHISRDGGLWALLRDPGLEVRNAKELFEAKSTPTQPKQNNNMEIILNRIINSNNKYKRCFSSHNIPTMTDLGKEVLKNSSVNLNSLINEELNRKSKLSEDTYGMFHTQFYYNKSKHGDNFYQIIKKLPVKNQYHDWEDYYLYKQCGTGLEFLKPVEMFNKEFKKVRIVDNSHT